MSTKIVFETHFWSEDNDRGAATGWLAAGCQFAAASLPPNSARGDATTAGRGLPAPTSAGRRRPTRIAYGDTEIPILYDWRLRECDYGEKTGTPAEHLHRDRAAHLDVSYPDRESRRQAVTRTALPEPLDRSPHPDHRPRRHARPHP